MTTLYEQIKKDRIQAMKDRNEIKKSELSTLFGEIDLQASKPGLKFEPKSDLHVVAVVKKFLDDNKMTQENGGDAAELAIRAAVLREYLPVQLTAAELSAIIIAEFGQPLQKKQKGEVLKFLKNGYPGQFDGLDAVTAFDDIAI